MSKSTTKQVPYSYKIAFGMGMLANQMFPAVLGIFMVVLVQDLGFPGWMWGILFFLPRVFDSFTDPIMGFISDNTRSKWGRRRQYVFIGAILMGISFMVMWQLYAENGVTFNFLYFLGFSIVFFLGLTIFSVPYVAMGYEMSNDFHERTQIMAIAQWIGQWAWVIAPWFWVIMYDPTWFASAEVATRTLAIWVGGIFMLCAMIPAFVIKSESTVDKDYSPLTVSNIGNSFREILTSFKEAFQSIPFRKLCVATFFIFNAFNTVAAFTFFVIVYHLFGGDSAAAGIWPTLFGSLGAIVTTFVVIPIVAKMSKMIGKKRAFMWSQGISIVGYALFWFLLIPGKPYMFIFALPFFSFGIGSLFTLMMSMTADVIDLDEMVNGVRREGVFGAIYWWMVKFGFAIAGGLSGVIISIVGFNPDAIVAPGEIWPGITGLRIFFSGLPILGTLVALYVMRDYDIDEEKANEIREILEKRQARKEEPKEVLTSYYEIGKADTFESVTVQNPYLPLYMDLEKEDLKTVFQEQLEYKVTGICFSPYLEGQKIGDQLTKAQIKERIKIIEPHAKSVRSFSCTEGNEITPKQAKKAGLDTVVGAWLSSDLEKNEKEITALIKLAKDGVVNIAAVGNEALMRDELSEDQIIHYLKRVKKELPDTPVTYVDAYYEFLNRPKLLEQCDIILINCYPFWEGYSIDESIHVIQKMYALVKEKSNGKRIIISETGWPTAGAKNGSAVPSLTNMMKYFTNLFTWSAANDVEVFYFSSFDESWKFSYEGEAGTSWGIWNSKNELKIK
jgi:GPH family glycoside/pentoside/hexuronide:cation symporter